MSTIGCLMLLCPFWATSHTYVFVPKITLPMLSPDSPDAANSTMYLLGFLLINSLTSRSVLVFVSANIIYVHCSLNIV